MNRALALIEGDLTIPLPRPFDGLPPPFGVRRRLMREAVHQAVNEVAKPARASLFPPGVKHVLFYKAPPQRLNTHGWDAVMAEAKRYLEMDTVRPRSSRADHLLAAGIFAGCTIALTWLLVTCSMKEAETRKTASVTPAVAAWQAEIASEKPQAATAVVVAATPVVNANVSHKQDTQTRPTPAGTATQVAQSMSVSPVLPKPATQSVATSSSAPAHVAQSETVSPVAPKLATQALSMPPATTTEIGTAASPSYAVPKRAAQTSSHGSSSTSKESMRTMTRNDSTVTLPEKAVKRTRVARLSEAEVNERVALSRATNPAAKPAASKQPEWAANAAPKATSSDDAPWLNWAAQPYRPSPGARAATPLDNSWNDRMTQRRITDDPDAFHTGRGGQ